MLVDIIDEVSNRLKHVAITLVGERELASNTAVPRYIWIIRDELYEPPTSLGGNPRSIHDIMASVSIVCWGRDLANAEQLKQAVISAIHYTMLGVSYRLSRSSYEQPDWTTYGSVITLDVTLRFPLILAAIVTSEMAGMAGTVGTLISPIGNKVDTEVMITEVMIEPGTPKFATDVIMALPPD